jgi:signal recognition particle subunit SRP72
LFLLLQSDQYAAALSLLEQEPAIANGYLFEKAYVLYRMHKEDEAFEIIQGLGVNANDRGVSHLDAQLVSSSKHSHTHSGRSPTFLVQKKYRQGDYESAQSIYNTLLDTSSPTSDEHTDIITNLTAAESHIDFLNKGYLTSLHSLSTPITTLESSAPPVIQPLSRSLPIPIPSTSQKPVAEEEKLKLKQPRKSRLPKHVVLGVTPLPDPERWLKKRERTKTQEGRGKKGKKAGMGLGATQGSTMGDKGVGVAQSAPTGGGGGKKSKKTK